MIAALSRPRGLPDTARDRIAGLVRSPFVAENAVHAAAHGFDLWGPAASVEPGVGNSPTLFFGHIDNRTDMRAALGLGPETGDAGIYRAALARWGKRADLRIVGHYSAISILGPQQMRLVRSPWTAPPLHFVATGDTQLASPLLAVLFAAGAEKAVDYDYLRDQLALDHHDLEMRGWFRGISRVPLGTIIETNGTPVSVEQYYDPLSCPDVRFPNDGDYVERAWELLEEAARTAVAGARKPAILLSGGLDSPLAAVALLRAMPAGQALQSYTFGPVDGWDGISPAGTFGEEREKVRHFAAMHPQLRTHFPDPSAGGHDYRLRELLTHSEMPTANIANIGVFHGLMEAAANDGCDAVFTAGLGNFTISLDGGWSAAQNLRSLEWDKLLSHLLAPLPADDRSITRRFLTEAVLPNLPAPLQRKARRYAHPGRFSAIPPGSPLRPAAAAAWRAQRGHRSVFDSPTVPRSREQAIAMMWASADSGEDLDLAMARLHGIPMRDITAYRPLIEFCHGLPAEQFRREGCDRMLARRMARGVMPEAQRLDHRQGRHNCDWHARMAARLGEFHDQFAAIAGHDQLSALLDLEGLVDTLRDWGSQTPVEPEEVWRKQMAVTRALTAATFVSHAERRNDF